MDKNAIKKYAVWARNELIARVSQKAQQYGITAEGYGDKNADSVNGVLLSATEKKQRQALIAKIDAVGKDKMADKFEQVMEEVAYTWFNRFTALRFMEVNNYLPSHTRVFTNEANEFKPQILVDAISLELEGLDMDKVYAMKDANKDEELYKYLLIVQCNALSGILPGMFQKIADYTELLLPDYLLRQGSVLETLISSIPEADFNISKGGQIEIMGWLYQDYVTEQNEMVYDGTLSRSRITKELLPAATTIYTPDWAVRYMVDNSLGKLWKTEKSSFNVENIPYYLENGNPCTPIGITPESIKCLDPCMGSGHILMYMFDVLISIYESYGFGTRDAVASIVQNNLYGLDIDNRAAQIAYFAVMMKACQYDRRFLHRGIQPNLSAARESNSVDVNVVTYFANTASIKTELQKLMTQLKDAKEYGSIIVRENIDFKLLYDRLEEVKRDINILRDIAIDEIKPLLKYAEILNGRYDVVVTNPPYFASSRFSIKLSDYVVQNYPDEKSDLSTVMYKRSLSGYVKANGYVAFITTSSWMYLSSFEKFRRNMLDNYRITSLVDFGTELFEGKVGHNPIVAWVCKNTKEIEPMISVRLVDYCYSRRDEKQKEFFNKENYYIQEQESMGKIPGSPIAYWVSEKFIEAFDIGKSIDEMSDFTGSQHITSDNGKYLRLFWEVDKEDIGEGKNWAFYAKGGDYRKWFGNIQLIVDTSANAMSFYKSCKTANCLKEQYWFQEGITYSAVTSKGTGFRYYPGIGAFDKGGPTICRVQNLKYVLGLLNSKVAELVFKVMNPTINLQVKDVKSLPIIVDNVIKSEIESLVDECISLSKDDWNQNETSSDFEKHPMIGGYATVLEAYKIWKKTAEDRFVKMKENEEQINRLFIRLYGLEDELSYSVDASEVTISVPDEKTAVFTLISYSVGCMFGRYSIKESGIINTSKSEEPYFDKDNIIPISDDEYYSDDIINYFISFIETAFSKDKLEENLSYIASVIGGKGTSREVIRRFFMNDFFNSHCSNYSVVNMGKRPIYWLFDSGKKGAFKCLIYVHRYRQDTVARIRTDYVHEIQSKYRTQIENLQHQMRNETTSSRVKLNKELADIQEKLAEITKYEEMVHHLADQMISFDQKDGIRSNYERLQSILAKIK